MKIINVLKSKKGQGLVEYLVLVAVVAVASIGIVSLVSANIQEHYARISNSITGRGEAVEFSRVTNQDYRRRGMSNYHENSIR